MDYHFNPQIFFDLFLKYFLHSRNKPLLHPVNELLAFKNKKNYSY